MIVQVPGSRGTPARKKTKRTIIRPSYVASLLIVMYVAFIYLVLATMDDGTVLDSGAAYHLIKSVGRDDATAPSKRRRGPADDGSAVGRSGPAKPPRGDEHPDLVHFCGECMWKDTLYDCDARVAWEMENKQSSEFEAKKRNLLYCTKPNELHVSDFCGECKWKDMSFDCNTRVAWEVSHKKLTKIEAQKRNMPYCKKPPYILSEICGHCVRDLTNMTSKMFRGGVPCYDLMYRRKKKGLAKTMVDAARMVAEEFPECGNCHPENCWKGYFDDLSMSVQGLNEMKKGYLTKYWRFDQAAPKITSPTTLTLPSIPEEFRIPPSRFADIETFLIEVRGSTTALVGCYYLIIFHFRLARLRQRNTPSSKRVMIQSMCQYSLSTILVWRPYPPK